MPDTTEMRCRHVFTDGRRCAAACLRREPFCYYHHTTRRPVENAPARRRRSATFTLPELEDRAAIQLALSEVLQRIASNDIDPKRAGHLLFGLQIATSLLPKEDPKARTQPRTVAEVTHDPELGDLAPVAQIGHDKEPSELDRILAALNIRKPQPEVEPLEVEREEAVETLPTVQAVAASTLTPLLSPRHAAPLPYTSPNAPHDAPHASPLRPHRHPRHLVRAHVPRRVRRAHLGLLRLRNIPNPS